MHSLPSSYCSKPTSKAFHGPDLPLRSWCDFSKTPLTCGIFQGHLHGICTCQLSLLVTADKSIGKESAEETKHYGKGETHETEREAARPGLQLHCPGVPSFHSDPVLLGYRLRLRHGTQSATAGVFVMMKRQSEQVRGGRPQHSPCYTAHTISSAMSPDLFTSYHLRNSGCPQRFGNILYTLYTFSRNYPHHGWSQDSTPILL